MDVAKLETFVKKKGLSIVDKVMYRDMTIFIADGYQPRSTQMPKPHYFTFFAVGRNTEKVDIGSFAIYEAFMDPLGYAARQKDRTKEALEAGKHFIDNCKRVAEYDA